MIDLTYSKGADWAYKQLVKVARHSCGEIALVREYALLFRPEILEDCFLRALVDLDWNTKPYKRAYAMVRDVCQELTKS